MQYLQRLEIGDKIFIIDEDNQIEEIVLRYEHLKENKKDRRTLDGKYQLKSDIVESGQYILAYKSHISRRNGMGRMSRNEEMVRLRRH